MEPYENEVEVREPPENAVVDGVLILSVSKLWYQKDTQKGDTKERIGMSYDTPYGTEALIGIPVAEDYQWPEGVLTAEQYADAIREATVTIYEKVKK